MNDNTPPRVLDPARLAHSGILGAFGLLLSAWIGVLIGGIIALIWGGTTMGVFGMAPALGAAVAGLVIVPAFGFGFAAIGLSLARDSVIRGTGTRLLPYDDKLRQAVADLAGQLNLPAPQVGVYPDEDLNAFAAGSGPRKAVVSFTKGLTEQATWPELMAIAAHEVAHIANNDMRRMQRAISFQRSLTWYLGWTQRGQQLLCWVLGTLGQVMVLRLSREREYWADATAAALVGKEDMIAALRLLDGDPVRPPASRLAYARLMIRSNPSEWFATHPPIAKRIEALETGRYLQRLSYKHGY